MKCSVLYSLCHDNGDSVVENALTKNEHVECRVDVQGMEDGQSGYWVNGGYQGTKGEAKMEGARWGREGEREREREREKIAMTNYQT